ncbi:hypothetical protein WJX81_007602 [Elliptochloris bilobata]|uniref:AAA+ ATPase domain-containing protein n=1 Tax=Elliptochloris bilobata TaxID=381761 RepID=A0AAW1SI40_9CHLO
MVPCTPAAASTSGRHSTGTPAAEHGVGSWEHMGRRRHSCLQSSWLHLDARLSGAARRPLRAQTQARLRGTQALFGWGDGGGRAEQEELKAPPPRPDARFTKKDIRRLKTQGPRIDDLTLDFKPPWLKEGESTGYKWIPDDVIIAGGAYELQEPQWLELEQMSFMEFFQGLRERNWTTKWYQPKAEPWKVEVFQDCGRLLQPSFPGYRAVVTRPNGSQAWVDMPYAGADTFTHDHLAGGTKGGNWRAKRSQMPPVSANEFGYNQVFEQLFQAYEQKLPKKALREFKRKQWVNPAKYAYDCPGERMLEIEYKTTPKQYNLHWIQEVAPAYGFLAFSFSFLIIALGIGIFRPRKQMPNDPIQAMEFAQSKGQARKDGKTGVLFADVAGCDDALRKLGYVVEFLRNPKKFQVLGGKPPKGILLEGDPGTGKTLLAKAIAGEAGVPFYQMSGSEFVEAIVGVGAARVRDLFKRARVQQEPCIIFVDEIDALGVRRAEVGQKTNEEREQTLNQLLSEMDGFTPDQGVVFVAATNRADLLDPALLRAGRFDEKIRITRPDTKGRYEVLKVHARSRPMADDVDLMQVAQDLPGLSGAELENVLNEAALEAVRRGGDVITSADVYDGMDRILQGVRRPGLPDRMRQKYRFAVHEVGKALVATVLRAREQRAGRRPRLERVERVSMVPRGTEWTRTLFLRGDDEDYTMSTRGRMLERIRVILGGRAAEQALLPEGPSTYSVKDMEAAGKLAEKVVANYGMTDLGIFAYAPPPAAKEFGQRSFEVTVDNIDADLFNTSIRGGMFQPADQMLHRLRTATYDLVRAAFADSLEILDVHREALAAAADALMERETLTGHDLEALLDAHPPSRALQPLALGPVRNGANGVIGAGGNGDGHDLGLGNVRAVMP